MSVPRRRPTRSMPSKYPDTALRDILHHIDLAERFVEGIERDGFSGDVRTVYAVTRCLEIISEAHAASRTPRKRAILPFRGSRWRARRTSTATTTGTWR